ncbi:uncharacterized protein LOC126804090 isoform X2 [Argentina anserina]|uniref:uncharacterized protein LOC126804090 isoform X2 n=1 Tax=Argentina anserina TaxID=57926 RepID=UPI0021763D29|nr:uncharacterized protein LOC126804090 isoform X2 [Potentilla anserina]
MMGFGTYGCGGPYLSSSSSSSLSALAPPFTVERPVHDPCMSQMVDSFTPLVEVTEPPYATPPNASLHNWLPPHSPSSGSDLFANPPPAFGPVPSSNAYRYAGLPTADSFSTNLPPMNTVSTPLSNACTYDQGLDVVATSLVEAKPYYPSYLSPALRGDSPMVAPDQPSYDWLSTTQFAPSDGSSQKEYTQRPSSKYTAHWGGSWNGPAEWEQGKQGQFDGSFGPKETDASSLPYKNYLNQEPHSSNSLKKYEIASHNIPEWNGSMNAEHVGDKSYVGRNSKFSPIDFTKPMMGSFSVVPETHSKAPSSPFVMKSTYGGSCEKRQHDTTCSDITSISKPSPGFIIRPSAIGTKSSEPEMGLFKRLNSGRDAANADHVGYYPSQESHLRQSFVGKVTPFDSSQLAIHLGRIDPFSVESSSTKDKALSNNGSINNDSLDHFFKVKSGLPNCHVNQEGFDAAANINDSISSFLNSSENVDPNNPSVDSPCWKGVPGSCFSPFKASEGVPEKMKKQDGCNGLNLNMPMIFSLNTGEDISSQKPVEYHEFGWLGNGLPPPLKKYSVGNSAFGEHRVDDTMKTTYYPESSHDIKTPNSESGDKFSSLFEHSHIVQQDSGEGRLPTETKNTTGSVGADVNLNINDTLECGSSHTSPVKSTVCAHSLVDATTKLTKADGEESIMNMDVQMLINTMNSLSELLLTNCSSSSRQLKNKDLDALKTVISNLNSCILKHEENLSSIPESPSVQQSTLKYIEELSKHDENVLSMPDSPPIQQSTLQYVEELCKPNKALSPDMPQLSKIFAPSIQDPLDLQGVQRLTNYGSFVKNDDEVIASVSAKSDIDLLKQDEMTQAIKKILSENFHTKDTHPQTLLYKNLWLEAEASLCSTNYKARFNRLKIEMEKCKADLSKDVFEHDMMTQLRSDVPANSNPVEKLTPEVQDCPLPKFNPQELPSLNHEDDDVMARFHVLRSRIENSSSMNATNGDGSSSSLSLFPDEVDKVAPETDARPSPRISLQDSPTSSITGLTNDYEASVMARFHIIRDRVENSKFISDANVENPVSFKVSCEHEADEVAPETTDDGSIQDYPVSTTTSHANQYEHSVLARFNILKSRVDNSGDKPAVGEPQEHGDLGYAESHS